MDIGARIRELRKSKDFSIIELANKVGITNVYLSDIERGNKLPTIPTLQKICSELGTTFSEFFNEEISPETKILMNDYDSLDENDKKAVQVIVKSLSDKNKRLIRYDDLGVTLVQDKRIYSGDLNEEDKELVKRYMELLKMKQQLAEEKE